MKEQNENTPENPERALIGLEEGYSRADTEQMKIIMKQKKEEARKAKQERRAEYKNTVRPRKKTRTAVLLLGGFALLTGVVLSTISMTSNETETVEPNTSLVAMDDSENIAKEKAIVALTDVGSTLYTYLADIYGEDSEQFQAIEASSQEEGIIVPDSRGESYIISGEVGNLPADFDVDASVSMFKEPLEEDPLWNSEDITDTEGVQEALEEGDTLIKSVKFHGVNYTDGTPTALTLTYSKDAEGKIRVRVDASVLIGEIVKAEE